MKSENEKGKLVLENVKSISPQILLADNSLNVNCEVKNSMIKFVRSEFGDIWEERENGRIIWTFCDVGNEFFFGARYLNVKTYVILDVKLLA